MSTDSALLKGFYKTMQRLRLVEERVAALYSEQEMRCPTHLYIGQEAVATGVCANLRPTDYLFGTYRSHGIFLAKGGDLKAMLAELYGKKSGCCKGKSGSMQMVAPDVGLLCTSAIVGGTLPMAVGAALAISLRGGDQISCVVFGDGATEEGVFHESMNFASLKKLPVVFVCENNLYSVYSHISKRQCADNIYERAQAYKMPGVRVDGNNVSDVYEAVKRATELARSGGGPSLVECRTYRWLEHVGSNPDVNLGYRTEKEVSEWMDRCPVKSLEARLLTEGSLTPAEIEQITRTYAREIDEAFAFAKKAPFPEKADLTEGLYA
jgi:TPP-dependent pyruvate/acetoin dehydrogenase alpha subunit